MSDFAVSNVYEYTGSLVSLGLGGLLDTNLLNTGSQQSGVFTDDDGQLDSGDDGTTTFTFDGSGDSGPITYLGSGEIYTLGLLGLRIDPRPVAAFQVDGKIYLYTPDGMPLLSGLTFGLDIDPNEPFVLPEDGKVDGLDTGESMSLGYTDAQGDEITTGSDEIYGNGGDDTISASGGDDIVYGGEGADVIDGGSGDDLMFGGEGNDTFVGGGGTGKDTVYGGAGDDVWLAGDTTSDSDDVYLEEGDDYAEIGFFQSAPAYDPDILDGGDGQDTIAFDAAVVDDLDTGIILHDDGTSTTINFGSEVTNFEHVRGSSGDNAITGNILDNELLGLDGEDTLSGGGGADTLDGGAGNDTIDGGEGDDLITGGTGADDMSGGDGDDTFFVSNGAEGDGDVISGGSGPDDTADMDVLDLTGADIASIDATPDANDDGALTGTVTFANGEVLTFSGIEKIICFARGTLIETDQGEKPIESLKAGDLVLTADNGLKPISWIGSKTLDSIDLAVAPKLAPIRIAAGALGDGIPERDLILSRQHRVLIRSAIAERMFGEREVLVPAIKLVECEGIEILEETESVEYFHMLFDQHEVVYSNGAATESLFTGPEALKSVSPEAREEILTLFPDIADGDVEPVPTRYMPQTGRRMKQLVERHKKNNKPLFSL